MRLTFPIDTTDIKDIPGLSGIAIEHPGCEGMLRYLCYRFDPRCKEVRGAATIREKQRVAEAKSGWHVPDPGTEERKLMEEVCMLFFPVLNNPEWEYLCSLEFLLDDSNRILRTQIDEDAETDAEAVTKVLIMRHKASEGVKDAINTRRMLIDSLADGDEDMARAVAAGRPKRGLDGRIRP